MEAVVFNTPVIISIESHRTKDDSPSAIRIRCQIRDNAISSVRTFVYLHSNWRPFYLFIAFPTTICVFSGWHVVLVRQRVCDFGNRVRKWAEDEWQVVDRGFRLKTIKYGRAHLTHPFVANADDHVTTTTLATSRRQSEKFPPKSFTVLLIIHNNNPSFSLQRHRKQLPKKSKCSQVHRVRLSIGW